MKVRFVLVICIAVLAMCTVCAPVSAALSATKNWEATVLTGSGLVCRSVAVDPNDGTIYVQANGQIAKFGKDGGIPVVMGPWFGTAYFYGGDPAGMAVDPKTGYLYAIASRVLHVIDTTTDPPTLIRTTPSGLAGGGTHIVFSQDGSKLYVTGNMGAASNRGVYELARNDAGTPDDYTDDTFAMSGVALTMTGVMPATDTGDPRGCTVDSLGRVYQSNIHGTRHPIRRFIPSGPRLDAEFYVGTNKSWGCSVDASDNFWVGDYNDAANAAQGLVRCYSGGMEAFSFNPGGSNGGIWLPSMIACDRANGRVIVAGLNKSTAATEIHVQSWKISGSTLALGTITGNVLDSDQGYILNPDAVSIYSSYSNVPGGPVTFYGQTSPFSCQVPPGTYNVRAVVSSYTSTAVSHYQVAAGQTTATMDIPMPWINTDEYMNSPFVRIQLGEHNIEQGLYMRSTSPGSYVTDIQGKGAANFTATVGGTACRGFGRAANGNDELYMNFDVDDAFMGPGATQGLSYLEMNYYDDAAGSRWNAQMDCQQDSATNLGLVFKQGTNAWKTLYFTRNDANFANRLPGPADIRLGSLVNDTTFPPGPHYFSTITLRKYPVASSYQSMSSITDIKKLILSQGSKNAGAQNAGGFAVTLNGQIVTASWPSYFYIEDVNRNTGLRVVSNLAPAPGSIVDITGYVGAVPETQEMCIYGAPVNPVGSRTPLPALAINGRTAGGGPVMVSQMVSGTPYSIQAQPGVSGGSGLSNIGLFVRITGRVATLGSDGSIFVDDGSGMKSDVISGTPYTGLKLVGAGTFAQNQYIIASGVLTLGLTDPTPAAPASGDEYYIPIMQVTTARSL